DEGPREAVALGGHAVEAHVAGVHQADAGVRVAAEVAVVDREGREVAAEQSGRVRGGDLRVGNGGVVGPGAALQGQQAVQGAGRAVEGVVAVVAKQLHLRVRGAEIDLLEVDRVQAVAAKDGKGGGRGGEIDLRLERDTGEPADPVTGRGPAVDGDVVV